MGYKDYSDAEIAEALVKLAVNKYDFEKTAIDTKVSVRTLKRWATMSPKKGIPDLLDRAIERMLMVIPDKWDGNSWAIALGILIDKWLLLQGEPTSRTESLIRGLKDVSPDDRNAIIQEAERILAEATSGGAHSGEPETD